MSTKQNKSKTQARRNRVRSRPESAFTGHIVKPPLNPPDVVLQPFNSITVVHAEPENTSGVMEVKVSDLTSWIKTQVDPRNVLVPAANQKIVWQFKVHSVRVWNLTGKTIAFSVTDFANSDVEKDIFPQLSGSIDTAGKDSYACCGYEYSAMHRSIVLRSDLHSKVKLWQANTSAKDGCLTYVKLLWKFEGPISGPVYGADRVSQILSGVKAIQKSNVQIRDSTNKQVEQLKKLNDAQPGLVSRIVDGVTHVGAYVAPIAGVSEEGQAIIDALQQMITHMSYDMCSDAKPQNEQN